MTLKKKRMLETERISTSSHSVENSFLEEAVDLLKDNDPQSAVLLHYSESASNLTITKKRLP